jgi:hypothetical protein
MRTCLSIDLDYFSAGTERGLIRFFNRVLGLRLPIFVSAFHDQMLPWINSHPSDLLLNVDYHSDIQEIDKPALDLPLCELGEGNWSNYVEWKENATFSWRYPKCIWEPTDGFCHGVDNPFKKPCSGWKAARMKPGLGRIPWHTIHAIGVCLSPAWLFNAPVKQVTDQLGISHWMQMTRNEQIRQQPFAWNAA